MKIIKVRPYSIYSADTEAPYAFSLSDGDPRIGVLIAPVVLKNFSVTHSIPVPDFRSKAFICLDQIKIIPVKSLIKRVWNMSDEGATDVLCTLQDMVSGHGPKKGVFF